LLYVASPAITLRTLAIGAAGALTFWVVGLPLPFMTGSAAATAGVALARHRLEIPVGLRQAALVMIGAVLGAAVTPETLALLPRWPVTIIGLAGSILSIMVIGAYYLEHVHGYDRATARLSSIPGALTQAMALALESQADARRVTIIQVTRLAAILFLLPSAAALMGVHVTASLNRPGMILIPHQVVGLMIVAAAGAWLFNRLRAPAPTLVGAMAAGALLYGSGLFHSAMPDWLLIMGFVVLGAMIGINFGGTELAMLGHTLVAAAGSFAVCALVALAWSLPLAVLMGLSPIQVWLAYSPGGVETSSIIAMAIGLDVAFVSSHHVIRVLILNLTLPWWLRSVAADMDEGDEDAGEDQMPGKGRYY
jgi:membrane AbrB-like protein